MTAEESQQVGAVVNAAQGAANELSLAGSHVLAAQVAALIQVTRVLWTHLAPKKEEMPKLASVPPDG